MERGISMRLEGQGLGLINAGGGTIELTEEGVIIKKKNTASSGSGGFLDIAINAATSTKGELLTPYEEIRTVNISLGGFLSPPFIQVLSAGEAPASDAEVAKGSPSCLLFKKHALPEFQAMKAEIETRVAAAKSRAKQDRQVGTSPAEEIRKLGLLMEEGLLTREEFEAKKKQILGL
jgi:hypothetical protein